MKRLVVLLSIIALCLGQNCVPPANDNPPADDGSQGDDSGMNGDDHDSPDDGMDDHGNDMDSDNDSDSSEDSGDHGDGMDDSGDDSSDDDSQDDESPDDSDDGNDSDGGMDDDAGDDDGSGDDSGEDDSDTAACADVDLNGTWFDGSRDFEITQENGAVTSLFVTPLVCDHEDGQGTTTQTNEDFTADFDVDDCRLIGTITVCRFGCTAESDDCSLDENGLSMVEFEGVVSEDGQALDIEFVDPVTGDAFDLSYTRVP